MAGLWYEDLHEGQVIDAEWTRTVTEFDNVLFCSMTMNVQKLHLDAEFAAGTEFGRPLVNSIFTLGLVIGMSVHNLTMGTTVANLGMTDTAFPAPLLQCYACKREGREGGDGSSEAEAVSKCIVASCGRYYHPRCIGAAEGEPFSW